MVVRRRGRASGSTIFCASGAVTGTAPRRCLDLANSHLVSNGRTRIALRNQRASFLFRLDSPTTATGLLVRRRRGCLADRHRRCDPAVPCRSECSLMAWLAGALFLPSFALALGIWSGSSKPYEGLLTALWYIGPMNRTPGLDFTGAANGPITLRYSVIYLALSAALLTLAFFGRARQLRSD